MSEFTVRALDESTWPAFAVLVEHNNGVFGGCWCMGFHEDNRGGVPPKRERKLARVRAGTAHAALVDDGDDCLGWCQFGAPDEVPRIKNRAEYEKGLTALPDWRIACNFVGKGNHRKGVATAALAGAPRSDRLSRRRAGGGLPGGCGHRACGISLPRRSLDVRKARVHPRPQNRQAPLGRCEGGQAKVVGDAARATLPHAPARSRKRETSRRG